MLLQFVLIIARNAGSAPSRDHTSKLMTNRFVLGVTFLKLVNFNLKLLLKLVKFKLSNM